MWGINQARCIFPVMHTSCLVTSYVISSIKAESCSTMSYLFFCCCSDKDALLWLSAGRWSSSWKELSVFTGEESPAVLRSVEWLQNHSQALWWPVHAGVLHQLWVRSLGEDTGWLSLNVNLEFWRRVRFNGVFFIGGGRFGALDVNSE